MLLLGAGIARHSASSSSTAQAGRLRPPPYGQAGPAVANNNVIVFFTGARARTFVLPVSYTVARVLSLVMLTMLTSLQLRRVFRSTALRHVVAARQPNESHTEF